MQDCLIQAMQKAEDATTIGELKEAYKEELAKSGMAAEPEKSVAIAEESALEKRIDDEDSSTNLRSKDALKDEIDRLRKELDM